VCYNGAPVLPLQLLRRVGFSTTKAFAMFRPSDMVINKAVGGSAAGGGAESAAGPRGAGATVSERHNLGWTIKYTLRFDDDVVRPQGMWHRLSLCQEIGAVRQGQWFGQHPCLYGYYH
jgi:hypothetical protein